MAAPNLKNPTNIYGDTAIYNCTATLASALSNAAASNKVLKINSIRAANVDDAASINVDVTLYRGTTHTYLAKNIAVPLSSTLLVLSRDEYLYLEEGDAIYAKASSATKIDLIISYEEIS